MNDDEVVLRLREALRREADAVQPAPDGLQRIRAAIEAGPERDAAVVPLHGWVGPAGRPRRIRPWFGVAAAAAAVLAISVTAAVLLRPAAPVLTAEIPAGVVQDSLPLPVIEPLPVYFAERQGTKWALVREFEPTTLTDPDQRLRAAVQLAISGTAADPDYTSVWRSLGLTGTVSTSRSKDLITVTLPRQLLPARSALATTDDVATLARLAVDQLVWTATATTRASLPVVVRGTDAGASLLGELALDGRFSRGDDPGDPRAPVSVSTLTHGELLRVGKATISGDATAPALGGVTWALLRVPIVTEPTPDGAASPTVGPSSGSDGAATLTLDDGSAAKPGQRGSWKIHVTLTEPGQYTLVVRQTGSDWAETKTFTVR